MTFGSLGRKKHDFVFRWMPCGLHEVVVLVSEDSCCLFPKKDGLFLLRACLVP